MVGVYKKIIFILNKWGPDLHFTAKLLRIKWDISLSFMQYYHAGHTRKASRISKAVVDNCGKG